MAVPPPRGRPEQNVARTVNRANPGMPSGRGGVKPVPKKAPRGRRADRAGEGQSVYLESQSWQANDYPVTFREASGAYSVHRFNFPAAFAYKTDVGTPAPWSNPSATTLRFDRGGYYSVWLAAYPIAMSAGAGMRTILRTTGGAVGMSDINGRHVEEASWWFGSGADPTWHYVLSPPFYAVAASRIYFQTTAYPAVRSSAVSDPGYVAGNPHFNQVAFGVTYHGPAAWSV